MTIPAPLTQWHRHLIWNWGPWKYIVISYLLPIGYALPVYVVVWLTGLGGFYDTEFLARKAADFGWTGQSPAVVMAGYIALTAVVGIIISLSRALGEEIGWRGFLVPELAKVVGFHGVSIISGILWAAWHYPILAPLFEKMKLEVIREVEESDRHYRHFKQKVRERLQQKNPAIPVVSAPPPAPGSE